MNKNDKALVIGLGIAFILLITTIIYVDERATQPQEEMVSQISNVLIGYSSNGPYLNWNTRNVPTNLSIGTKFQSPITGQFFSHINQCELIMKDYRVSIPYNGSVLFS